MAKKHDDLVPFQLYAKLPHPQGHKGQWITTDGSHVEPGTKYRMFQPTNASGGRRFVEAINVDHGIVSNFFCSMLDQDLAHPSRLMRTI